MQRKLDYLPNNDNNLKIKLKKGLKVIYFNAGQERLALRVDQ